MKWLFKPVLSCSHGENVFPVITFTAINYIHNHSRSLKKLKERNKMANEILLKTIEKLTNDEIEGINDFLISYGKRIMNTKDRKAMLEYWSEVAKENEQFFNFLEDLFTRIDGPVAAAALNQVVNNRTVCSADESNSNKGLQRRQYSKNQFEKRICIISMTIA